jgi:hypothetical protein
LLATTPGRALNQLRLSSHCFFILKMFLTHNSKRGLVTSDGSSETARHICESVRFLLTWFHY